VKALADAIRFLTVIPLPHRRKGKNGDRYDPSRALAAYPWAGLLVGVVVCAAVWTGSLILGVGGAAVVALIAKIVVTGGLHLDGVADLGDGMGGGRNPERRLEIMRDSRIGSFGVLAIISVLALQTVLLRELFHGSSFPDRPFEALALLALIPVISRGVVPLYVRTFPSARRSGTGSAAQSSAGWGIVAIALGGTVIIAGLFGGIGGLAVAAVTALLLFIPAAVISRSLGGLTGDVYGALIEFGEVTAALGILVARRIEALPIGPIFG
jgi:adenosylcobinamide-GDP ribazoletransferase